MGKLSPIQLDTYEPLREVVSEALREAIRTGVLQPGERLMEIQLSEDLGVSRTPVREAIRKLDQEGYIVMMPRRGAYVASITIRDVNEIFEIRRALESLSSSLAAERISADELETLQRLLVEIGRYIKMKNMEKIVETDIKFHDLLYQASRNERLVGIISNLREQLTRFRTFSMSHPGRLEETLKEHRAMVDAIAKGDAEAAKEAALTHMERSEQTLLDVIEEKKELEEDK